MSSGTFRRAFMYSIESIKSPSILDAVFLDIDISGLINFVSNILSWDFQRSAPPPYPIEESTPSNQAFSPVGGKKVSQTSFTFRSHGFSPPQRFSPLPSRTFIATRCQSWGSSSFPSLRTMFLKKRFDPSKFYSSIRSENRRFLDCSGPLSLWFFRHFHA